MTKAAVDIDSVLYYDPFVTREVRRDGRSEYRFFSSLEVRLYVHDPCGRVVDTLGPGEMFGEMALIDGSPRSAEARTKGACELQPIDERAFLSLVRETPYFALDVMRTLALRLRAMNERI